MGLAQVQENLMLGGAYYKSGLILAARDAWDTAALNLTSDMPVQVAVRVHNALGSLYLEIPNLDAARAHFTEAKALCEATPPQNSRIWPDYPKALNNLALTLLRSGETDAALPLALSAVDLTGEIDDQPALVASINLVAGACYMDREEWQQARVRMAYALNTFRRLGDRRWEVGCLNNLGIIALEQGDTIKARELLEAALTALDDLYDAGLSAYIRTELSRLHFRQGDVPGALHHGSAALRVLWDSIGFHDRAEVARLCRLFAFIFALKGDRPAALGYLQRATTYFAQSQMWREWGKATQELDDLIHGRNTQRARVVVEYQDQELLRYLTTLLGLMDTLESLYPESAKSVELVTKYAVLLGTAAGLDQAELARLSSIARLRDVGLTSESDSAARADALTGGHCITGARILAMFGVPTEVLAAVRNHHEYYDGSGHPDKLVGKDIPLEARILAIAEHYVNAVEREAAGGPGYHQRALAYLKSESHLFDPELLSLLFQLHAQIGQQVGSRLAN